MYVVSIKADNSSKQLLNGLIGNVNNMMSQ